MRQFLIMKNDKNLEKLELQLIFEDFLKVSHPLSTQANLVHNDSLKSFRF